MSGEFKKGPTLIEWVDFWQRCQGNGIRKGQCFQQTVLEHVDIQMGVGDSLGSYTLLKVNSKWIIDQSKSGTIKLVEENFFKILE